MDPSVGQKRALALLAALMRPPPAVRGLNGPGGDALLRVRAGIWGQDRAHSNSMITSSTFRLSPGVALTDFTTAIFSARRMFSIFIASTVARA